MAKYLKVPLESPWCDGYILRGTNEKGETVYLCPPTTGDDFMWLTVRSWAYFCADGTALKEIAERTLIPAYNIPVDDVELVLKRDPRAIEYENNLQRFIQYSEVIEK